MLKGLSLGFARVRKEEKAGKGERRFFPLVDVGREGWCSHGVPT